MAVLLCTVPVMLCTSADNTMAAFYISAATVATPGFSYQSLPTVTHRSTPCICVAPLLPYANNTSGTKQILTRLVSSEHLTPNAALVRSLLPVLQLDLGADNRAAHSRDHAEAVEAALNLLIAVAHRPQAAVDFSKVPGLLPSILNVVKRARPDQPSTTDVALSALRILEQQAAGGQAVLLVRMGALSHVHALMGAATSLAASHKQAEVASRTHPQLQTEGGDDPDACGRLHCCLKVVGAAACTLLNLHEGMQASAGPPGAKKDDGVQCGQGREREREQGGKRLSQASELPVEVAAALSAMADIAVRNEVCGRCGWPFMCWLQVRHAFDKMGIVRVGTTAGASRTDRTLDSAAVQGTSACSVEHRASTCAHTPCTCLYLTGMDCHAVVFLMAVDIRVLSVKTTKCYCVAKMAKYHSVHQKS